MLLAGFKGSTIQTGNWQLLLGTIRILDVTGIASLSVLATHPIVPFVSYFKQITRIALDAHGILVDFKVILVPEALR